MSYMININRSLCAKACDTFIGKKMRLLMIRIEQMPTFCDEIFFLEVKDTIVVASVSAIYGLGDPDSYLQMMLHLNR